MKQRATIRKSNCYRRRGGFALVLVMIFVVTAVILGLSYMSSASIHTAVSKNLLSQAQARYLAESGIQHGMYLLKNDPNVTGARGPFTLRNSVETYNITISPGAQPGTWTIGSTANVKATHRTTSATVSRVACPPIKLKQGMFVGNGSVSFPWGLVLNSDVQINGYCFNLADINGSVTATQGVDDYCWRISGDVDGSAQAVTPPAVTVAQYSDTYSLNGQNYTSTVRSDAQLKSDSNLGGGAAITATNIGGVVYLRPAGGTVQLWSNFTFQGTIVIDGNVEIMGTGVTLTAVNGFPAIVASGCIKVDRNATAVVNGLVVAKQGVISNAANSASSLTINGGLLCDSTGVSGGLAGSYSVTYQKDRAQIYDFSLNSAARVPKVCVVNWND